MHAKKQSRIFSLFLTLMIFVARTEATDPPTEVQYDDTDPLGAIPGADTLQHHFQVVCLNCRNGDESRAARRIRRGIELLRKETKHANEKGKAALHRSIRELDALAETIENGTLSSIAAMDATFARSLHALSYHYQQRANESRRQQNFQRAGKDLQAAADNVAYGLAWVGEGVQTKSRDVIVATRDLSGSLVKGTKLDAKHFDAQSKALGLEIKRFGQKVLKPVRRQP